MKAPLVSIILPTYNGKSERLSESIESVLNQTYTNFELIIINDASTNNIEATILKYEMMDSRIIYLMNEMNRERSFTKNRGIKSSKGKYIAFIDDDDIWNDIKKIEKQVKFMETNKDVSLCGTDIIVINEIGDVVSKTITKKNDKFIRNSLIGSNQFAQSSVMVRKEDLKKSGLFNESMFLAEDYDLRLRIGLCGCLANLDFFGLKYRDRNNNTSNKYALKMRLIAFKISLKYIRYYPNKFKGTIIHLLSILLPKRIIKKLVQFQNYISR